MELAKLIWVTPDAEIQIMHCARVSNPKNQDSEDTRLLDYCIKNKHWSIFEMANLCIEINTSRAIARQILRHRSFTFQEFSQRYADVNELDGKMVPWMARSQDTKNRQNSKDDYDDYHQYTYGQWVHDVWDEATRTYRALVKDGVAKECARAVLPEGLTPSRMYMNGTVRSWLHFLELRTGNGTQLECQQVANACREIFKQQLPTISKAMGW